MTRLNLPFFKSVANFVLFDTKRNANICFENLLKKGIILRPVGNYGFSKYLRMTIGQAFENEKAIQAIEKMLTEVPELV